MDATHAIAKFELRIIDQINGAARLDIGEVFNANTYNTFI